MEKSFEKGPWVVPIHFSQNYFARLLAKNGQFLDQTKQRLWENWPFWRKYLVPSSSTWLLSFSLSNIVQLLDHSRAKRFWGSEADSFVIPSGLWKKNHFFRKLSISTWFKNFYRFGQIVLKKLVWRKIIGFSIVNWEIFAKIYTFRRKMSLSNFFGNLTFVQVFDYEIVVALIQTHLNPSLRRSKAIPSFYCVRISQVFDFLQLWELMSFLKSFLTIFFRS